MATSTWLPSENSIQLQEKSDTLEKKLVYIILNTKEWVSACHIRLLTPLTPVRYSILSPPNLLILCDICDMKASQAIRTANNAQHTRETVSQSGYNMLLRQKCLFAIMPYYFDQFLKLQKSPCQELVAYTYLWQIQESHLLNCLKRTGVYYTMYLSA